VNDNRIEFRDYMAVGLVKHTARDTDVIVAALVSTMGEESAIAERSNQQNKGLINYLMRDRHGSPFEHNSMTFLVNAPIFVARQFMRHRTGWSYNEESGRYRELQPVFYMPSRSRNLVQTGKTGAYVFEPGSPDQYGVLASSFESTCTKAWRCYQRCSNRASPAKWPAWSSRSPRTPRSTPPATPAH
jgi:thymidylate synthase (FAD)